LQSATWGRFKSRFGWNATAFLVEWAGASVAGGDSQAKTGPLLVLSRKIAPGICMAYVPWGPELPANFPADSGSRNRALAELARGLRPLLPRGVAFARFDPPWFAPEGRFPEEPPPLPFRRAGADIQPPDTVVLDLTPQTGDILSAMKPKWRYNIGLAEKRGVTVTLAGETADAKPGPERDLESFYALLGETATRDGIAIHSLDYYEKLFAEYRDNGAGSGTFPAGLRLYTARHEADRLAAIVVLFRGKEATYLYGASSNAKRNLMAPYALQWRAMLDAKAAGCTRYDLFGIPPNEDPEHPMAGLYRFKTGFGGNVLHRPGSWDYPCKPVSYALFRAAERLRKKLRDGRKRR